MSHKTEVDDFSGCMFNCFDSAIGWLGIAGTSKLIQAVFVGHPSQVSVVNAAERWVAGCNNVTSLTKRNWNESLQKRLLQFAEGQRVEFDDFRLDLPKQSKFREKVLEATRRLKYGMTISYGELAQRVGHPGAARAVGTVMSTNRFPILIPCHRVLASGGKLGGYTAPQGIKLKQRLLDMERSATFE